MRVITRVLLMTVGLVAACDRKPNADAETQKAMEFLRLGQYGEAIVEARKALQADPLRGEVHAILAEAYLKKNDANAVKEYVRAADLLPEDAGAQIKAGGLLLIGGQYEDAKARADRALAIDPNNVDAQVLRGNALAGLQDLDGAITNYENAMSSNPADRRVYLSLGALQLAKGDPDEAEKSFKKAVELQPKSVSTRLALANFYWSRRQIDDTERELKAALALSDHDIETNRVLATFYVLTGRAKDAEPYFQLIAATSGSPKARLSLAQYFIDTDRRDQGRKVLQELTRDKETFALATVRLAGLDAAEGNTAQALQQVSTVLAANPADVGALLLQSNLQLNEGKRAEALASAKSAIAVAPTSSRAHLMAARAYIDSDRHEEALASLQESLKADPRSVLTLLELGRLQLATNELDKAMATALQALAVEPRVVEGHDLLARVQLRKGETKKARQELDLIQKSFPNSSAVFLLTGLIEMAEGKTAAARVSFARTLAADPGSIEALERLTKLDMATGHAEEAARRIDNILSRTPPTADLLVLAALSYAKLEDGEKTEAALRKAIDLAPDRLIAYQYLGRLYAGQRRLGEARGQFEKILAQNPRSVAAATMLGLVAEAQGDKTRAESSYRQALAIDPTAPVAANNLANIYLANGDKIDEALRLVQDAKRAHPNDPFVNDTMGWIYLKKRMGPTALPLLESAASQVTDHPSIQYHLGMALFATGDMKRAKASLEKALTLSPAPDEEADIRKTLSILGTVS